MYLKFPDANSIKNFIGNSIDSMHPIIRAAKRGKLIFFVGAGMSVHLGIPGWRSFALKFLDLIYDNKNLTFLNFKTKESLANEETRKLLSICKFASEINISKDDLKKAYEKWFKVNLARVKNAGLYEKLYSMNAIYITTNYDNALDLLAEQPDSSKTTKTSISSDTLGTTYYKIEDFKKDILAKGNVIHIHGSINDCDNLLVSYEDYIKRYNMKGITTIERPRIENYNEFLEELFNDIENVFLFIGYGLEEIEILQYLFNRLKEKAIATNNNRFLLLPCYADEFLKVSYFNHYYENNYDLSIIPLDLTDNGYDGIKDFLDILLNLIINDKADIKDSDVVLDTLAKIRSM